MCARITTARVVWTNTCMRVGQNIEQQLHLPPPKKKLWRTPQSVPFKEPKVTNGTRSNETKRILRFCSPSCEGPVLTVHAGARGAPLLRFDRKIPWRAQSETLAWPQGRWHPLGCGLRLPFESSRKAALRKTRCFPSDLGRCVRE